LFERAGIIEVAAAAGERAAQGQFGIDIEIFHARYPIRREGALNAGAGGPSGVDLRGIEQRADTGRGDAGRRVSEGRISRAVKPTRDRRRRRPGL
jgi:hypothetical protein